MTRHLHILIGAFAGLAMLLLGSTPAFAASPIDPSQRGPRMDAAQQDRKDEGPIEILIVQGYVKSIDEKSLTLTAPGAPADLPLRLAPDTRFIQEESDITRGDVHEGQLVRAALIPTGEEFLAVVVELVPDGEGAPAPKAPSEQAPDSGAQSPDGGSKL